MSKITKERRAALQSVRAKARKAIAVVGAELPAAQVKHLEAVIAYVDTAVKVTPIKADKPAKATGKTTKAAKTAAAA